jgi:hypothetical protein
LNGHGSSPPSGRTEGMNRMNPAAPDLLHTMR